MQVEHIDALGYQFIGDGLSDRRYDIAALRDAPVMVTTQTDVVPVGSYRAGTLTDGMAPAVSAMLDALNQRQSDGSLTRPCAFYRHLGVSPVARPNRLLLGMAGIGADNTEVLERVFLVLGARFSRAGETRDAAVVLREVAQITWQLGTLSLADVGAPASHVAAKSAGVAPTGALLTLTGREIASLGGNPATVVIPDVGPGIGVLRVVRRSSVSAPTSASPLIAAWR